MMHSVVFNRRTQETALAVVSCLFVTFLLSACAGAPKDFADLYVTSPQAGVSARTMSGILLAQKALAENPANEKLPYSLSYLYLQAARENADTAMYDKVEAVIQRIEDHGIHGPEHQFLRGLVAMAKHDFRRALSIGTPLVKENPSVQRYYGLLADAQIELGKYDDAIKTLQAMADINPDASAMTRIAYVREIYGDRDGAKEAMEEVALQQSGENAAWSLCELARLWLQSEPAKADILYDRALAAYPGYAPALAGKARVAMTKGDTKGGLTFAEKAFKTLQLPEYATLLGDIHSVSGEPAKAKTYETLVTVGYEALAKSGTNVDLEHTRFLIEHHADEKALDAAVARAKEIHEERGTIYTADLAAWGLYQAKNPKDAWTYIQEALRTGTHDPTILFHAGMIALANGDAANAKKYLGTVKTESPTFSFVHQKELDEALKGL